MLPRLRQAITHDAREVKRPARCIHLVAEIFANAKMRDRIHYIHEPALRNLDRLLTDAAKGIARIINE